MVDLYDILLGDVMPESGVDISMGRNTYDPPAPAVPFHDIHSRSFELHDSGASGIVKYHAEQNRLEVIPGNSGAQPITTNVSIHVDVVTGGTIEEGSFFGIAGNGGTYETRYNSDSNVFNVLSSGIIQINMSGIYDFRFDASATSDGGGSRFNHIVYWTRQRVNETGFSVIPGTDGHLFVRNASVSDADTVAVRMIRDDVQAGDLFWPVIEGFTGGSPVGPAVPDNAGRIVIEKVG